MTSEINTQRIAKEFWVKFMEHEPLLHDNIIKRDIDEYNQSINE